MPHHAHDGVPMMTSQIAVDAVALKSSMSYLRLDYTFMFALVCDCLAKVTKNHEIPFNSKDIAGFRVPTQADDLQLIMNQYQQQNYFLNKAISAKNKH